MKFKKVETGKYITEDNLYKIEQRGTFGGSFWFIEKIGSIGNLKITKTLKDAKIFIVENLY